MVSRGCKDGCTLTRQRTVTVVLCALMILLIVVYNSFDLKIYIAKITSSRQTSGFGRNTVSQHRNGSQWVITTSELKQCTSIVNTGWNVIVVKAEGAYIPHGDSCVLQRLNLSAETSEAAAMAATSISKFKTLSYLYAIKNGATAIYDSNYLPPDVARFQEQTFTIFTHNLKQNNIEPTSHFWCRLDKNQRCSGPKNEGALDYIICDVNNPPVLYKVMNTYIADSIQSKTSKSVQSSATPLLMNPKRLYTFSRKDMLYTWDSHWLSMPMFEDNDESVRYWWMYSIQIALRASGHLLVFLPGVENTIDNVRASSNNLNTNYERTLSVLRDFACTKSCAKCCITNALEMLLENKVIEQKAVGIFHAWIKDLQQHGYYSPMFEETSVRAKENCPKLTHRFSPSPNNLTGHYLNQYVSEDLVKNTCQNKAPNMLPNTNAILNTQTNYHNLLLVVVFNLEHYEAIPYLEATYRMIFPHIIYCGPGYPPNTILKKYDFSFITFWKNPPGMNPGAINYECLQTAIDLGYNGIKDYLFISDDVMVNHWNLKKLPRDKPAFQIQSDAPDICGSVGNFMTKKACVSIMCLDPRMEYKPESGSCWTCQHDDGWVWWKDNQAETLQVIEILKNSKEPIARNCHQRNLYKHGSPWVINARLAADIYYIPEKHAATFSYLAKLFKKHLVFLEIALPMICNCLNETEIIRIPGTGYWGAQRDEPWNHYPVEINNVYFHPSKLGFISKGSQDPTGKLYTNYFCDMIYSNMIFHMAKVL